jgi:DNA protecting protein DprA
MQVRKILPLELEVFQTFGDNVRVPPFIDVASKSEEGFALLRKLPSLGLAIVGTRYPQRRSVELLEKTMQELRGTGLIIISGFARGIDSRAHELALEYGLKTIAILGCGIEVDYPQENRHLRHKILDAGGLLISEVESNCQPFKGNFVERNRLIAGFSSAVWVVEGAGVSGTLSTATWAMKAERDLYATSCFPNDPFYEGNQKLLSQKDTDRYPIARAFFAAHSFGETWNGLALPIDQKKKKKGVDIFEEAANKLVIEPKTRIQKWVVELKAEFGECQVQSLMNLAHSKGITLGSFYREYEQELKEGYIRESPLGRVELGLISQ